MKRWIIKALLLSILMPGLIAAAQTNQNPDKRPPSSAGKKRAVDNLAQRSRTITGRVVDETGQPVADAIIVAAPVGIVNMPQGMAMIASLRPTSTDDQGKFLVEDMKPGVYTITPAVPGYVVAPSADDTGPEPDYYRPGDIANIRMIRGGVITGRVTTSAGQPIVGVRVSAHRIRDLKSRPVRQDRSELEREWKTDDRGQYRIYGLQPGAYVVNAGGRGLIPFMTTAYDSDAPTYHPSSNRDTAGEVTLHSGEEISGVDIQYRDNRGFIISGTVTGGGTGGAVPVNVVALTEARGNAFLSQTFTPIAPGPQKFSFDAIPDGEYFVIGISADYKEGSELRRVVVRGADVSGIEISIRPFGSIEGRIVLEPMPDSDRPEICKGSRPMLAQEAALSARSNERKKDKNEPDSNPIFPLIPFGTESVADEKGKFKIGLLAADRYRVEAHLPGEDWYMRSVTLPPEKAGGPPLDAAKSGIPLKPGEQLAGVSITFKEGAGGLRGRVVAAKEGARLPERLRVHLVPAEKEAGDDTLRFYETAAGGDRAFSFTNVAPGKYWIIARRDPNPPPNPSMDERPRPMAWDAENRLGLRRDGEAANMTVELQPCQRAVDYTLRYEAAPPQANKSGR